MTSLVWSPIRRDMNLLRMIVLHFMNVYKLRNPISNIYNNLVRNSSLSLDKHTQFQMQMGFRPKAVRGQFSITLARYKSGMRTDRIRRLLTVDKVIILLVFGHPRCAAVSKGCEGHTRKKKKKKKSFGCVCPSQATFPLADLTNDGGKEMAKRQCDRLSIL